MTEIPTRREFINGIIKQASDNPVLKENLLKYPKETIEMKLNFKLPEDFEILVHRDTPAKPNIILPIPSEELTEAELDAISAAGCYMQPSECESYYLHSDGKLKDNAADLGSALHRIIDLRPRSFKYKTDGIYAGLKLPGGMHYGFVAQELEKVFPELVRDSVFVNENNEEIKYKSVALVEMIPVLIQGIKEQQQMIEDIKREIEILKKSAANV